MEDFSKRISIVQHPLEHVFGIAPNTTIVEQTPPPETIDPPEMPTYDDKDNEIDQKLEQIYNVAMGNVTTISGEMEIVEGKYKARIGEVTANMLSVALAATREKALVKAHKDKLKPSGSGMRGQIGDNNTITNNVIMADRNEILRAFMNQNKQNDLIDGETS